MRELAIAVLFSLSLLHMAFAVYAWVHRWTFSFRSLLPVSLLISIVTLTYAVELVVPQLYQKITWMQIRFSAALLIPLSFLYMVHGYQSRPGLLKGWRLAMLLAPVGLIWFVIWTAPFQYLFRHDFRISVIGGLDVLTWDNGPIFWMAALYSLVLICCCGYLLAAKTHGLHLRERLGAFLIILALFLPLATGLADNARFTLFPGLDITPFSLFLTMGIVLFGFAMNHWQVIVPLARSSLVDMIPIGFIVLDSQEKILDLSAAARSLMGVNEKMIGQPFEKFLVHFKALTGQDLDPSKPRQEFHFHPGNGPELHYEVAVMPLAGGLGESGGRALVIQDITDIKTRERRLLQLAQIVEQSPTSILITNLAGNIEYVNPNFSQLTGFSQEEALNKNASLVSSGQTSSETYEEMWQTISSGQTWRGEFLNKKKQGELYWEKAVIAPIKDHDGAIINYIAIKEDITDQKIAEEELRKSEGELRLVNARLSERIAKIQLLENELREQAIRDPLTGLYNRRYLNESIEREILHSQRSSSSLCAILLDIDHFKEINDVYGHQAGDAFLMHVANQLQKKSRRSDIVCRFGGEEFLLLLPNTEVHVAVRRAEEFRRLVAETSLNYQDHILQTTISAGVACSPLHGSSAVELLRAADEALYMSKNLGRDRVTVYQLPG